MRRDSGDRTYFVTDERLREFSKLTPAQRLEWVEQCSKFIRLARLNWPDKPTVKTDPNSSLYGDDPTRAGIDVSGPSSQILLEALHRKALRTGIGERTRSLLRGFRWTMPAAMYSRVVCGLTTVLAARTLGPADFGLANLALATTLWVQVPLFMGIPAAITHFVPQARSEEKPAWILGGFRLLFACGTITLLIGYGLSPLWSRLQGVATAEFNMGLLWCLGFFLFICATTAFNALENFRARAIAEVVFASLFPLVILWTVLDRRLTAGLYVGGLAIAYGITGLYGLVWNFRTLRPRPASSTGTMSSQLLRYGALASLGAIASALFLAPARVIANQYLSLSDVGILSAYQSGSIQMASFLLGISSQVFFPIASRTGDKEQLFRKITRLMLTTSPLVLSSLIGSLALYFLILGKGYPWRAADSIVFCIAAALSLFQGILGWYLAAFGRRGLVACSLIGLVSGAVNVAGCFLLIPDWKILGAGIANIASAGSAIFLSCLPQIRKYSR